MTNQKISIPDLLRLALIPGIGATKLRALVSHFGTPADVLHASPIDLIHVEGIEKTLASHIVHTPVPEELVDEQLSLLNRVNGRIITLWDDEYPELLRKIYDPPPLIFVRGGLIPADKFSIAIVGTRHPTPYGKMTAERFARELCEKGLTILSGLARGIDTIAHAAAVDANGRTVAVIGSGIDVIYPSENAPLAAQIESQGAIVSEFFMGTTPDPGNFPRRNRIISGMAFGTLVIETTEEGGAMITASTALDQNRELFAIPGHITEKYAAGTNSLIQDGHAKLVKNVDDIIEELEVPLRPILRTTVSKPPQTLTIFEQSIFDVLTFEPLHIDAVSEQSRLSPSDTLVNLLSLEFKGLIRQMAGKMFVKI